MAISSALGGYTSPGLILVKTQTIGTGVTSIPVTDVFNSFYDNYLITLSGGASSATGEMSMTFGSTSSGYHSQFIFTSWNNTISADSTKTGSRFNYVGSANPNGLHMSLQVLSPNLAKWTRVFTGGMGDGTSYVGFMSGLLNNTTQYTGFTLSTPGGTVTFTGGTIRVYGYRN
jgi:hypothetical protein